MDADGRRSHGSGFGARAVPRFFTRLRGVIPIVVLMALPHAPAPVSATEVAAPIVEQLLGHAGELRLSAGQVDALRALRTRRQEALRVLSDRFEKADDESSAAAQQDAVTLLHDAGRLRVLSGRDALLLLTPEQRRRWVALRRPPVP